MHKFVNKLSVKAAITANRVKNVLQNERGDFYISDGVKIIIAVVLGALLLAALTAIFNDTVIPRITREIEALFG
ncbi:DUF6133 family protein [Agathobacter rectalis]|jgi:uncharacterized membrane protein|uniref:DUF6133 family protein n=1 Tax=Agathobacter rectalis TaxID=39491 RepID=UPI0027D25471|nr:DUF6133 family protein [Agathobacter rectalis]MCQ5059264.1 DUF6133 family protein [Agathobacter rectalis]